MSRRPTKAEVESLALAGAGLAGRDLRKLDLSGALLAGARLTGADLRGAKLAGADLRGARLDGADLRKADLSGALLAGASLVSAVAQRAVFAGADLSGAVAASANLFRADLSRALLTRATLSYANLEEANLAGADLSEAALAGAYALRARLDGARVAGADLTGADLSGARWEGATLERCETRETILRGARKLAPEAEERAREAGARTSVHPIRWARRRSRPVQAALVLLLLAALAAPVWWFTDPVNRPVRDVLDDARMDMEEGHPERAASRLQRKFDRWGLAKEERRDLARSLVDAYARLGRPDDAVRVYRAMTARYPDDPTTAVEAELGLAAVESQRGGAEASLPRLQALAARFDSGDALSRQAHGQLASALLNARKPEEALREADKLIVWAGEDVPARQGHLHQRALALAALGRAPEAAAILEDLARYYASDPGRLQGVLWDLAGVWRTAGDGERAISAYERIAGAFRDMPDAVVEARRQIAMARTQSDPARATEELRAIAKEFPDLSRPPVQSVHADLAGQLARAKDFEGAAGLYDELAGALPPANPVSVESARRGAEALRSAGKDAEAARRLKAAADRPGLPPESRANLRLALGDVLEKTEGVDAAVALYRSILQDKGLSTGSRGAAGASASRVLRRSGRGADADAVEAEVRALTPGGPRQP